MLSKEKFIAYIDFIKEREEKQNKLGKVFEEVYKDAYYFFPDNTYESKLVELLRDIFNDENDWIGYFIWELDFGKEWRPGTVTENGEDIKLETAEDLYELLLNEQD